MCFPLNFTKLILPASTCTVGTALAAGSSCTLVMQFNPTLSAGTKSATLTLTDNAVPTTQVITLSGTIITAAPPTVSFTSPTANTNVAAPGSFTLTATATAPSSTVTQVDYYANGTMVGTATTAPYSFNWNTVPTGLYSLTALVTDALGRHAISPSVMVAVSSGTTTSTQAYYIHTDHLDTPRVITDTAGNNVWEWQNTDPFGANIPNENPTGLGMFTFNKRFAGQYADKETNTFYNYFRDYDPATGRYIQSDPIGLDGGSWSTYTYVDGSPLMFVDPDGLRFLRPQLPSTREWRRSGKELPRPPSIVKNAERSRGWKLVEDSFGNIDPNTPSNVNWGSPLPGFPHDPHCVVICNSPKSGMCIPDEGVCKMWCGPTIETLR